MRRTAKTWIIALVVVGVAAWGVLQMVHPTLGPTIRVVTADRLREDGMILVNPFPWDQSTISQAEAEKIAARQGAGGQVLQSVLAEVILTNPSVKQPRLCWVASLPGSLVTSNGPAGSPQRHASFYLILIDAHTGEFVEGTAGG